MVAFCLMFLLYFCHHLFRWFVNGEQFNRSLGQYMVLIYFLIFYSFVQHFYLIICYFPFFFFFLRKFPAISQCYNQFVLPCVHFSTFCVPVHKLFIIVQLYLHNIPDQVLLTNTQTIKNFSEKKQNEPWIVTTATKLVRNPSYYLTITWTKISMTYDIKSTFDYLKL